jgi:hypothetical protein
VLADTFYLYFAGNGVYRSADGGGTWTQAFSGEISPFSGYNSELQSVPGEAGNLFFTGGPQGSASHPTDEGFFRSTDGGVSWTAVANVREVQTFGFGAPATPGDYPSIYIVGWVNSIYGVWQSNDDAQSWTQIGTWPTGSLDQIKTIAGDPNAYGQVYVGFGGSGYAYLPATPVDHAPPVAADDSYATGMNTQLKLSGPGVLANDTDPDGNALTATLVSGPSHGSVSLGADGSLVYTPTPNFVGTDSFTYKASDGAANSIAKATINVHNAAPVASVDSYATSMNTQLKLSGSGVLANDTDPDGNAITAALVSQPSHGSVSLGSNGSLVYTPNKNFIGTDSFTYKASDGRSASPATAVLIAVHNAAPVAADDSYATGMNTKLVLSGPGVLANDTDPDGNALTAALVSRPSHGSVKLGLNGSLVYTPSKNFVGTDSFTYKASDGAATSMATATIIVHPSPVAAVDSYATSLNTQLVLSGAGVLANDTDPDGNALTAALVSQPKHGSVSVGADGSLVYTPSKNFVGTDRFTYKASDGWSASPATAVSIIVHNAAPVVADDSYATSMNTKLVLSSGPGLLTNDMDPDGNAFTAALVSRPKHGSVSVGADGSLVYTPSKNFVGTDSFTYKASDGAASSIATATMTVHNVAPVAADDSYATGMNTQLKLSGPGVLANDTDPDGNALTAALVSRPSHGSVSLGSNGSLVYTPNKNFIGTDSFTYKASDGAANSIAAATISIGQNMVLSNDQILPPIGAQAGQFDHSSKVNHLTMPNATMAHMEAFAATEQDFQSLTFHSWSGASTEAEESHLHMPHDAHLLLA